MPKSTIFQIGTIAQQCMLLINNIDFYLIPSFNAYSFKHLGHIKPIQKLAKSSFSTHFSKWVINFFRIEKLIIFGLDWSSINEIN